MRVQNLCSDSWTETHKLFVHGNTDCGLEGKHWDHVSRGDNGACGRGRIRFFSRFGMLKVQYTLSCWFWSFYKQCNLAHSLIQFFLLYEHRYMKEIVSQISLVPNFRVEFVRIYKKIKKRRFNLVKDPLKKKKLVKDVISISSCISNDFFHIEMKWIAFINNKKKNI